MRALTLSFLAACVAFAEPVPWHTRLFIAGGDAWRLRVPLTLTNNSGGELQGYNVGVPVGNGVGQAALVGQQAETIRVCDEGGTEMLFDLRGPDGVRLESGPIPAGATLTVPLTAPDGGAQQLFVYAGNPATYLVPDYLHGGTGALNGGFESGDGTAPDEWYFDNSGANDGRRNEWVTESPHSGKKCVKTMVPAGGEASWIAVRQRGLGVLPGRKYRLTAWVKGQDVVGRSGWYVHVANPETTQKVSVLQDAGDGTFDWKQVTIEFTTPMDAISLDHGTVLAGSGTVWFDDVKLECLDADAAAVKVAVGQPERLELKTVADAQPKLPAGANWRVRIPVRLVNPGGPISQVLVETRATRLRPLARRGFKLDSLLVTDGETGEVLPHLVSGDDLIFNASAPARCLKTFWLWCSDDPRAPQSPEMSYADLVELPGNLARNPSFESGDKLPAEWPGTTEGRDDNTGRLSRVEGGLLGGHCAKITVPPTAPLAWIGWRQEVKVEPNAEYFFNAMVKTEGVTDGTVKVHAHLYPVGSDQQVYWSGGPQASGDTDWTRLGGLIASGKADRLTLHLTMNARGTLYHDGVVLLRAMRAELGELETVGGPAATGLQVWAENPVVKVFRDTPPAAPPKSLALSAGRGEAECLQLCLRASSDGTAKVSITAPSLGGQTLPTARLETVEYVPCLQPSGYFRSEAEAWERREPHSNGRTDGWRGWWPDYLLPSNGEVKLSANRTQPVWLTLQVPRNAAPGRYTGEVTVTSGSQKIVLPLTFTVWRQTMPEQPTLQVIMDLRNGRNGGFVKTQADTEQWWRFMAERHVGSHRLSPDPVFKLVDGQVTMETTEFDRAAKLYFDELHESAMYFPWTFYACGWEHPPKKFLGAAYPSAEHKRFYQQAVRLFWNHLKQQGWADRCSLYVSDEPHYYSSEEVIKWLGDIIGYTREVDPTIPVYSSTWGFCPEWEGVLNHWGIAQYGRFPMDAWERRRKAGDKAWFTTDGQMEIDTPYNACERLLPYYCVAHDVSGYEFWGISWYSYDPFKFGWHSYIYQSSKPGEFFWTRYPNGDGYLAYPGQPLGLDGPLSTIRLEQAREGIEDYEYFHALQALRASKPAAAKEIDALLAEVAELTPIPNAAGYRATDILPAPDRLTAVRDRAGALLDRLLQ